MASLRWICLLVSHLPVARIPQLHTNGPVFVMAMAYFLEYWVVRVQRKDAKTPHQPTNTSTLRLRDSAGRSQPTTHSIILLVAMTL